MTYYPVKPGDVLRSWDGIAAVALAHETEESVLIKTFEDTPRLLFWSVERIEWNYGATSTTFHLKP